MDAVRWNGDGHATASTCGYGMPEMAYARTLLQIHMCKGCGLLANRRALTSMCIHRFVQVGPWPDVYHDMVVHNAPNQHIGGRWDGVVGVGVGWGGIGWICVVGWVVVVVVG